MLEPSFLTWQTITRGSGDPYLERLILFRCRWFAVYLHRFYGSDDECLHDHPWPFLSVILQGGYWEVDKDGRRRWYSPGRILFRKAEWRHRIEIVPGRPTATLVIRGARRRLWGFWTAFGFIPWTRYSHLEHCP